ncbi:MAG: FG-GAP repeat protein, partial [Candidatus Cloacimonetes bacterium]|nr:FG-GAP repeat protein [Candidatus Cloacimonadota bacterium]
MLNKVEQKRNPCPTDSRRADSVRVKSRFSGKKIILVLSLILISSSIIAENYMDLIWDAEGEQQGSWFGSRMTAIDFNGDGIDDLVVNSPYWSPYGEDGLQTGKLYFYFGGTDFDSIPDLTLEPDTLTLLLGNLVNLGDVNGDGYEDLGSRRGDRDSEIRRVIEFYYGGPDYDTIPDFQHIIYNDDAESSRPISSLGDVNNDGYNDVGFCLFLYDDTFSLYIIYGGDEPQVTLWANLTDYQTDYGAPIRGIGNIN